MPELKPISKEAIPSALAKAERYRLLNEPRLAESICRDVLRTDAGNQQGLVILATPSIVTGWMMPAMNWRPGFHGWHRKARLTSLSSVILAAATRSLALLSIASLT